MKTKGQITFGLFSIPCFFYQVVDDLISRWISKQTHIRDYFIDPTNHFHCTKFWHPTFADIRNSMICFILFNSPKFIEHTYLNVPSHLASTNYSFDDSHPLETTCNEEKLDQTGSCSNDEYY
jgi:hypothetical protein